MSTTRDLLYQLGGMPVGLPLGLIPKSTGRAYFVNYELGSDDGDGNHRDPLKTLSEAHSRMTADQDDIAFVFGHSSATTGAIRESATLAWSKSMCHIVGLNSFGPYAHRVSIRQLATATNFTPLVNVTASGCVFANFHAYQGYATNAAQICWQDSGERNQYFNVHLGGMGAQLAADHAGSRSLKLSGGGERLFQNCTIGLDTVDRGAANASLEFASGATRDTFNDCTFLAHADLNTALFITANAAAVIDRLVAFRRCIFHNAVNSAGTNQAQAFLVHAAAGGTILLDNCIGVGFTDWETTASGNVMILGPVPTATTSGLAIDVAP